MVIDYERISKLGRNAPFAVALSSGIFLGQLVQSGHITAQTAGWMAVAVVGIIAYYSVYLGHADERTRREDQLIKVIADQASAQRELQKGQDELAGYMNKLIERHDIAKRLDNIENKLRSRDERGPVDNA